MSKAALDAVAPPASPEEKRRKRVIAPPAIKDYSRGSYGTCSIPVSVMELSDLQNNDRRIPVGCELEHAYVMSVRKELSAINALSSRPAND